MPRHRASSPLATPHAKAEVPWRPALVPTTRWLRFALVAILLFTFARGAIWTVTTPSLWGPDEDYHFLYVDKIARTGAIINPRSPLYSSEYSRTVTITKFDSYGTGARSQFSGDPKASLRLLEELPDSARRGVAVGRGVGVVHPPLYHAFGAAADRATGDASLPTRMLWVRMVSVLFGVLTVYATWLLAAQLAPRNQAFAVVAATVVATQPMLGYLSGLVNHDIALASLFTLGCAQLAFMLRVPPRPKQGLALGAIISSALLVKASAAALLPLAALVLLLQAVGHRESRRESAISAGVALVSIACLAGWWYVHSLTAYGTLSGIVTTGQPEGFIPSSPDPKEVPRRGYLDVGFSEYWLWTREWLGDWYKTGFFHFLNFESPKGRWWYFAPAFCLTLGMAASLAFLTRRRVNPAERLMRMQMIVLLLAMPVLALPFFYTDVQQKLGGAGFLVNAGRYTLPAYAPLVSALLAAGFWAVRHEVRAALGAAIVLASGLFCFQVYNVNYIDRYYGQVGVWNQFERMTFDRPDFVTSPLIIVLIVIAVGSFAATGLGLMADQRRAQPADNPA